MTSYIEKVEISTPILPKYETHKATILQFINNEIATLPENWDGYLASPIEQDVLVNVAHFIHKLPKSLARLLNKDAIFPNANGTISIEWTMDGNELFIEIGSHYATYYIKNKGQLKKINNQFVISDAAAFRQFIEDL